MARLHKMVNGDKVFLTEQEDIDLRARWVIADEKRATRREAAEAKKAAKLVLRDSLKLKLNLTDEELNYLRGK